MGRVGFVTALLVSALAACFDPAPPQSLGGATRIADGRTAVRIGTCLAGTLEEISVDVYRSETDERIDDDLWRVRADAGERPHVRAEDVFDVVLGSTPPGMVEEVPFDRPLPAGATIRVSVRLSTDGFGLFFTPDDLAVGTFVLNPEGDSIARGHFADRLADLCD